MNDVPELFWHSSLEDMKRGYVYRSAADDFICLVCGESFTNGMIYSDENHLYEAKKYIKVHLEKCHGSLFHVLLNMDKKLIGLTDHQKTILELFYNGQTDSEIARELHVGSTSTIRNHRFSLREKQKQAKVFLAIMELLAENIPRKQSFIDIPRSTKQVDDRFAITEEENEAILAAYFKQGLHGPLDRYPLKEKKRVAILRHILQSFDAHKKYTEKEVNAIIRPFYDDYVIIRRHLIEYGFMDRTRDGSAYWVKL